MLPNPQHPPAGAAQGFGDQPVPDLISGNLSAPVFSIARGPPAVPGAAMPEASVHEHRDLLPAENEIRLPEHRLAPSPAVDAVAAEQLHHRQLGRSVAAPANSGRDLRSLGLRKNVAPHCRIDFSIPDAAAEFPAGQVYTNKSSHRRESDFSAAMPVSYRRTVGSVLCANACFSFSRPRRVSR